MWKLRKFVDGDLVVLSLCGRIQGVQLMELQNAIASEEGNGSIVLDLNEVKLVDQETVLFLAGREAAGMKLINCPSYIREWIARGYTQRGSTNCEED
jgi:hypothetical protein